MANLKMGRNVELALDAKATLGEGPMWHARRKKLYWVDILEKNFMSLIPRPDATALLMPVNLWVVWPHAKKAA
jgi:sugar lactone lactonase YvrE